MPHERRLFGTSGEEVAATFLQRQGMKLLFRQKRTRIGEIDLVCLDGETIVFVEVKTRHTPNFGPPQAAITRAKFRHMAGAAQAFLAEQNWLSRPWRLDVAAVDWPPGKEPCIVHFPAIDGPASF